MRKVAFAVIFLIPALANAQALPNMAALKKAGADVTYIEVPGGSHTDMVVPNLPKAFEFMGRQQKPGPQKAQN